MKIKINDFIPPFLSRSLMKMLSSKAISPSSKFFLTYGEALIACSGAGYEEFELVETVFEKTKLIKDQMLNGNLPLSDAMTQSILAVFTALRAGEKRLRVVDFGGACGTHYFMVRPFIPLDVQLDWVVVETAAMVEKARFFETSELQFCNSLVEAKEKLKTIDFVHSSGALQYIPNPEFAIQEFVNFQPNYIFLNRLALSSGQIIITLQETLLSANGPGPLPGYLVDKLCRYPVTYFPINQLEEMVSRNYQMKFRLAETKALIGEKEIIVDTGMLLERCQ